MNNGHVFTFRFADAVGTFIAGCPAQTVRASLCILFTLQSSPSNDACKTRGQHGFAFSFLVGLFHPFHTLVHPNAPRVVGHPEGGSCYRNRLLAAIVSISSSTNQFSARFGGEASCLHSLGSQGVDRIYLRRTACGDKRGEQRRHSQERTHSGQRRAVPGLHIE